MMGRPPKPKGEVKDAFLRIRMTRAERKHLDDAASESDEDTSVWARVVLLSAAKRVTGKKWKR
jgi:hypothetical protein